MKPLPPLPHCRDLSGLLTHLDRLKKHDPWLKEAKKVVDAHEKAVRLLSAPEKIEADLKQAETARRKAEDALENARLAAEGIVEEAEAGLAAREAAIVKDRDDFEASRTAEQAQLRKARDKFDAMSRQKTADMNARDARQKELAETLDGRERAVGTRERRADARMTEAQEIKGMAEETLSNLRSAMPA